MLSDIYQGKTVLVTGHVGFKGSWLCLWLNKLGANVVGCSFGTDVHFDRNTLHFDTLELEKKIRKNYFFDISNSAKLKKVILKEQPDFIFHLAAQPLVSVAIADPISTWKSNVMGTVGLLECLRHLRRDCTSVLITSDKCYENREWVWGYRENDRLGGSDIYSSSKGAAEIAISSFYRTYFNSEDCNIKIASARAGNVIGGGDWSKDRLIPDFIKSWQRGQELQLRSPNSTRPWQHVFDPLFGYLLLGAKLSLGNVKSGHSFNFGPDPSKEVSVAELLDVASSLLGSKTNHVKVKKTSFEEAGLLKLNCDKAAKLLGWRPQIDVDLALKLTMSWYKEYSEKNHVVSRLSEKQLECFMNEAF